MWFMLLVKSASIPENSHLLSLLRKFVQQSCSNDVILIVKASPRGGESLKLLHESCYPMLSNLPDDSVSSSAKHGTGIIQSSVRLCLVFPFCTTSDRLSPHISVTHLISVFKGVN